MRVNTARFLFLDDLDFFLHSSQGGNEVLISFGDDQSVKHLIESLGIPHTEIGQVYVDDRLVELDYLVRDGDTVCVHPTTTPAGIRPSPPRFLLDSHLGRLSGYLRMLGLDCLYDRNYLDSELVRLYNKTNRILLSRDRRLLMHKVIENGYCVRSLNSKIQLQEVVKRYSLTQWIRPFQRCLRCNHRLERVSKTDILHRLEPLTKRYYQEFHICPSCDQIFWKGSHYQKMMDMIEELIKGST